MKLLRLKIGDLPKEKQFRSLCSGFEVRFREPDQIVAEELSCFNPFCLVGLNGTGKSNVLEALAVIFFHLECCVAKFKPEDFWSFRPELCQVDAFELEYLIQRMGDDEGTENFDWVRVEKREGEAPRMAVRAFGAENEKFRIVSLKSGFRDGFPVPAEGKVYLPDIVIGYSSGENEILSVPFLKSRLINFDKYKEDFSKGYAYEEPENGLIYIDYGMSQAVLLACLLFEDFSTTLKFLRDELGLRDIVSFRMNINNQLIRHLITDELCPVTEHIKDVIEQLKGIATCWYEEKDGLSGDGGKLDSILTLDFLVDDETRRAFRSLFSDSFECFRFFQGLYELNYYFLPESSKQEVYASKGVYTDGKIAVPGPLQDVFHFLDFLILKEVAGDEPFKELLLREFSDGEHQFLHTMGICLMLKKKRALMLLDEPETHFNPSWRSKFIQILSDGIEAGGGNNLMKDVLITSHSAFIISDCKPDHVVIFERDEEGEVHPEKAVDRNIKTYGTSVNLLTNLIFKEKYTIGKYAFETLEAYRRRLESGESLVGLIREINGVMGDSIEKLFLIRQFSKMEDHDKAL